MKYITAHSISEQEFIKEPFKIHDSLESILMDLQNAKKLYVLEIDDEISMPKKLLYNSGISRNQLFKNYYVDSQKKLIRLVRKVPIKDLLKNEKATSDYFFNYAVFNASELQVHSKNSLNSIVEFLINNPKDKIEPHLLINFCVKLPGLPEQSINLAEEYIINNYCETEMLIEFANKINNCNINKIVKVIADNDNSPHCLGLLKALSKIKNENLTLDYIEDVIIEKDKKGNLIYELANRHNDICNIKKLSEALDLVDNNGYVSYLFATNIKGVDKEFFQNSIAKKDRKGTFCIGLASEEGYDKEFLLDRVIELDLNNGSMVMEFVKKIPGCNLDKVLNYLLTHDKSGKYILEFAHITNGYNSEKIIEHISNTDKEGKLSFLFALTVPNCDISKLNDKINEINKPELFCNLFMSNITNKNKDLYLNQINKIDETGDIIRLLSENTSKKLSDSDIEILNNMLNSKKVN